ncbi:MAG: HlyD family efflux transporter periplasmic adaptor subunit [Acidobacteria bacterium]|nr:HlyD family efflux transporter periplasmic adaptor subunit [Acidobacteriota bacterium]
MNAPALPFHLTFFGAAPHLPEPALPQTTPESDPGAPDPTPPEKKGSWGPWLLLLGILGGAATWALTNQAKIGGPSGPVAVANTVVVKAGELDKKLRVGGTITATEFAAITSPRMRGPRDAGRSSLTLMSLAEPGSMVHAGDNVAEFELKWLEDHIDDRTSAVVQSKATVAKRKADILLEQETSRQAAVTAQAEYEKAKLDLRTAPVRSQIEAEVLKNTAEEAEATWKQLEEERKLKETSQKAELRAAEIGVEEDVLHLQRHQNDFLKMKVAAPVSGLVVIEPMYKGGGQFQQAAEGDQIYPGALFMRIVNLDHMVLTASLNQVDVHSIHMGQTAKVHLDAYPELELEGRVVSIGAIASESSGGGFGRGGSGLYVKSVPVEIAIHSDDTRVIPDLSASADILLEDPSSGLLAPREAIREDDKGSFVLVRTGQKFERRNVTLGEQNTTHVLIKDGVAEGDELLIGAPPEV